MICNHCGVMAVWSRKTRKFLWSVFGYFFGKNYPYGKIFKILFLKFSQPHQLTLLCSNVVKFVWREIGEIVHCLPHKKQQNFGCLSNCCDCTDCAHNLPGPAPNIWLTVFQISSKSVHFRQSCSRMHQHRSFDLWSISMIYPKQGITLGKINIK